MGGRGGGPRRGGGPGPGRVDDGRLGGSRSRAPRRGAGGEGEQAPGGGAAAGRRGGWAARTGGRCRARRARGQRGAATTLPSCRDPGESTAPRAPRPAEGRRGAPPLDGGPSPPARDLRAGGGDLLGPPAGRSAPPHPSSQGLDGDPDGLPRPSEGGLPAGHPRRSRRPRGRAQPPERRPGAERGGLGGDSAAPRGRQAVGHSAGGPPGGGGTLLGQPAGASWLAPWARTRSEAPTTAAVLVRRIRGPRPSP